MRIFNIIVIIVLIINMIWIYVLLRLNTNLDNELHEERKKAIKEINKLRKKD